MLCSWERCFTLAVPLSSQVYKWVPANLMLGVTRASQHSNFSFLYVVKTGESISVEGLCDLKHFSTCYPESSGREMIDPGKFCLEVQNCQTSSIYMCLADKREAQLSC